ncbi:hypothetical protein BCR37DRAFT_380152 [Protomyces lactucae-debilis]|uniref:RRM domain-containing protein n=1 Tax=Protomyces lactucae-debilis TaxID=2754530 RepID=A0A1Y2FDF1_PROLT|nr:uncharacterized protein BCR37DRAFT_380152 [Protomyces lactucae-debilis]ORY81346.1 hypothetical protein BCR37DRAFT_380152 [Protomyces lactucae-debilis]
MTEAPTKREKKRKSAAEKTKATEVAPIAEESAEQHIEATEEAAPAAGLSKRKRKAAESWSKKSKQAEKTEESVSDAGDEEAVEVNPLTGEPAKKKRKAAEKPKEGEEATAAAPAKAKRYTLFLGNLSFKTGKEEIERHLSDLTGGDSRPTAVRLQHDPQTQKFKGFAFLDFANHAALEKVLQAAHHTMLQGRRINVELTAGGGGTGEVRRTKIAKKNEKLATERENTQKTRREQDAAKRKTRGGKQDAGSSQAKDFGAINPARMARM